MPLLSVPTVPGLGCSRGHLNDPRARFCVVCGVSMAQASLLLVDGPRPSLGVLTFTDATSVPLDRDVVVGRDASRDARVRRGEATGLTLGDRHGHLSRQHAEVRLVGWDVQLVDLASTNGTFVYDVGRRTWHRLAPNHPYVLTPGSSVAFGRYAAMFSSPLRPAA
jgi:pSer/pThr/pTyr-binding forkhead associated (FHA) protein